MGKIAIVSGATGMDGSIMSSKLLQKGFKVYGIVRQSATPNYWRLEEQNILKHSNFELIISDITDQSGIYNLVSSIKPDWILNFAAQSEVGSSFNIPITTLMVDGIAPLYFLEAIKQFSPLTKFYTASTSEMYGNSIRKYKILNEETPMLPVSPYAIAKLASHHLVRVYKESYNIFACSGILFNHSCKYRSDYFIEKKICKYVAKLLNNIEDGPIKLGNLNSSRDIGYAPEFMDGIILMMESNIPNDYILCTGHTYTIKDIIEKAFSKIGIENWKAYIKQDEKLMRPNELHVLLGDNSKAKNILGWEPKFTLDNILEEMINYEDEEINARL